MKNLVFINGTMGVGKTATSKQLQKLLPKCVFLDGDWCWDASPFVVTNETKNMVLNNIGHLLNSFLSCSEYENIIFCWVMHEQVIIDDVLSLLNTQDYSLHKYSIICSETALISKISKDIDNGVRTEDVIAPSIQRLQNYLQMDTQKIDVSDITAQQAARIIYGRLYTTEYAN